MPLYLLSFSSAKILFGVVPHPIFSRASRPRSCHTRGTLANDGTGRLRALLGQGEGRLHGLVRLEVLQRKPHYVGRAERPELLA
jgi:hypothetical protein